MLFDRFHPYTFRNVRTRLEDGAQLVTGTLLRAGIPAARVEYATGSDTVGVEWSNALQELELRNHVAKLPRSGANHGDRDSRACEFILKVLEVAQEVIDLKRWCKKGCVYRLRQDEGESWWATDEPYSPDSASTLRAEYGEDLVAIANELPEVLGVEVGVQMSTTTPVISPRNHLRESAYGGNEPLKRLHSGVSA